MAHCFQGPLSSAQGKKKKNPLLLGVLAPTTLNLQFSEMAEQMYIFLEQGDRSQIGKKKSKTTKKQNKQRKNFEEVNIALML